MQFFADLLGFKIFAKAKFNKLNRSNFPTVLFT